MTELSVRGVIFDMDGTLADTLDIFYRMACDFLDHAGAPRVSRRRVYDLMARGDPDLIKKLFPDDFPELETTVPAVVRERLDVWVRRLEEETQPIDGCLELLHELYAGGFKLGIATSSPRALPYLDRWGVRHVFDAVVGREDVTERKPHPESVLRCVAELGLEPTEAVYVGDSLIDIEAGQAAGVHTVAVLTGTSTREMLVAASPDYMIETAAELARLLGGFD
jgi:HAD superfamily hydrolase (TIGR01509 family)